MAHFADYSTTAASNNAASPNGISDNTAPSTVDDIIQEFMARAKRNYADVDASFTAGGTGDVITGTPAAVDSYVLGQTFRFLATATNTTATTVNINSLGAKNLYQNGAALSGGEIVSGRIYCMTYDGTQFQLNDSSMAISQGLHSVPVPAMAMYANTTNGASFNSSETTTNKVMVKSWDFADGSTELKAQFQIAMPKAWNEGTITFAPIWTADSGSGAVVWKLAAVALSNDDALDTAFGTAGTSTDTLIATGDLHVGPTSSAITIAGTPAAEDVVFFLVSRDPTAGGDTFTGTARLLGIRLYITINAATDA